MAKTMRFASSVKSSRAETMAAKEGLQLAVNVGIRALILEGDAQTVMDNFGPGSDDLSHNGFILIEAYKISLGLKYFKAQYVPRNCNTVANRLAKLAKDGGQPNLVQ